MFQYEAKFSSGTDTDDHTNKCAAILWASCRSGRTCVDEEDGAAAVLVVRSADLVRQLVDEHDGDERLARARAQTHHCVARQRRVQDFHLKNTAPPA